MDITTKDLRERMSRLPVDELRAIVDAPGGEYTPEAIVVAREELQDRPEGSLDVEDDSISRSSSPVASSLRALLALLLIWIAWVLFLMSFVLAFSLRPSSVLLACVVAAIGAGLIWVASRVSESSRRLVTVVPLLFGCISVVRGIIGESSEFVFNGLFLLAGGALWALVRWWRGRRTVLSPTTAG